MRVLYLLTVVVMVSVASRVRAGEWAPDHNVELTIPSAPATPAIAWRRFSRAK